MQAYAVSAAVVNGSAVVTCSAAALLANAYVGDTLLFPNGTSFPIKTVDSNTQLTLETNFVGTNGTYACFITRRSDKWVSQAQISYKQAQLLESLQRGYVLTSDTSIAIGTGSKVFTTQAGLPILPGARMRAASRANPDTHWLDGIVTAYSGTSLTILVVTGEFAGSGSRADWNLNLSGARGPLGAAATTPGSTTVGRLARWTNTGGSALGETSALFEDGSGNVGIGTTTPGAKIDVNGAIFIRGLGSRIIANFADFRMLTANDRGWRFGTASTGTTHDYFYFQGTIDNFVASFINGFVIMANGNVGFGNTNPATKLDVSGPIRPASYTVGTVPAAASIAGAMIYVTNESGGAVPAFSDGTNWRRVTDRAIIS
jgi:hypothetical protein